MSANRDGNAPQQAAGSASLTASRSGAHVGLAVRHCFCAGGSAEGGM